MCKANAPVVPAEAGVEAIDQCVKKTCMAKSYIDRCEEFGDPFGLQACLKWVDYQDRYDSILETVAEDRAAAREHKERLAEAKAHGIRFSFLHPIDQGPDSEEPCSPNARHKVPLAALAKIRATIQPPSITELFPEQVERFIKYGTKYVYCAMCVEDRSKDCLIPETIEAIYRHLRGTHDIDTAQVKFHAKTATSWTCCWPRCGQVLVLDTQGILDHFAFNHFEYRG